MKIKYHMIRDLGSFRMHHQNSDKIEWTYMQVVYQHLINIRNQTNLAE